MANERTIQDVIMYFIQAVALPLTESDYRTLEISRFDIIKRLRFPDVFRVLLICLVYRSLPLAFPQHAKDLRKTLEEVFNGTYERYQVDGKNTEELVREYNELVDMSLERPFFKLANHVAATQRRSPFQAEQAEKLNKRLEQIFANFSTLGEGVEIVGQKS